MEKLYAKGKRILKRVPDVKPHLDLIAASLSIPAIIIALILNFGALQNKISGSPIPSPTPLPTVATTRQALPQVRTLIVTSSPQPTSNASCQPGIGSISIPSPVEGETVTKNPVCISVNYQSGNYCSVVWAYRVNGGPLSDYGNDSVCLYNLPAGQTTFELDVKSLVNSSTQTLIRTFTVVSTVTPTPTVIPTSIPSPTSTPIPTSKGS